MGEATIRETFRISGRGFAAELDVGVEGFGRVKIGDVLESPAGRALVNPVELTLQRDADKSTEFVALIVDDAAAPSLHKGPEGEVLRDPVMRGTPQREWVAVAWVRSDQP
jgi:hypothetical protein